MLISWNTVTPSLSKMSNNKIALVTGGSRGLGRDMAISLSKKGLDVIITYQSNKEAADEVIGQIEQNGQKGFAIHLDVMDLKSFDTFSSLLKSSLSKSFGTESLDSFRIASLIKLSNSFLVICTVMLRIQ